MLAFTLRFIKNKRYLATLAGALVIIAGLTSQHAWSGNGLPQINGKALAALAKQHPVVVLFRHAERCDRSDNTCLSDSTGITVNGAQDARALGKAFSADIQNYNLYSSNTVRTFNLYSSNTVRTVRTIQSATWFSAGRSLTVDKKMMDCGSGIYASINTLLKKSQNKNIVIFTHNHCLTYIAKNKRGVDVYCKK
ncbi:Polymyxin resistance protein PmrG [Salmonella enterica subsp. enterica serovar Montevideo str. S5-403]|uniref:Polymyxin resistance protein PmrG n=1 Tax=Salmonella enterica subsp. enterica serovar Montevideo str. S5-403 TaxID=913242 RepID=G5Q577_SALMO|nr:Polymyxin resistance protein PmrG [Salmonella enterica subsp. enterica serovar Montevideo str. S5-403]